VAYVSRLVAEAEAPGLVQLLSLRHDFPTEWHRFIHGKDKFEATLRREFFPYLVQGKTIRIGEALLYNVETGTAPVPRQSAILNGAALPPSSTGVEFVLTPSADGLTGSTDENAFLLLQYTAK
jgi:hypothetical protein